MPLLTATDIRAHVETDLGDTALQAVIDRLEAELLQRAGPHTGPLVEILSSGATSVFVRRPLATVTSVREGARIDVNTPALTVETDYRLWPDQGRVERLAGGAAFGLPRASLAPRFAALVEVTYTPLDDQPQRQRILLELVRLDLAQSGRDTEAVGQDYRYRGLDYAAHREALLRDLRPFLTLE